MAPCHCPVGQRPHVRGVFHQLSRCTGVARTAHRQAATAISAPAPRQQSLRLPQLPQILEGDLWKGAHQWQQRQRQPQQHVAPTVEECLPLAWAAAQLEGLTSLQIMSPDQRRATGVAPGQDGAGFGQFFRGDLPKKIGILLALIVFSRVGVYIRVPGVDVDRFAESMRGGGGGLLGYIDQLSGGSISKVGLFSLGIVPYINASIILQLLASVFPGLKKLQREEGSMGQARFQLYQKLAALGFAVIQSVGQLTYIRPFVDDFSATWLITNAAVLTAGSMILVHVADTISELKLGNGTSVLIFANIASALPSSVGGAIQQASTENSSNLAVYSLAFFLTTLGIVYVQEAERKIPMNYASRYRAGRLGNQSYLPFKVNATGVMPVIFASSLLAAPTALARYFPSTPAVVAFSKAVAPSGSFYLPFNVALIAFFNWYYTFLQLEPKDLAEQLKRQGASISNDRGKVQNPPEPNSGVRPGRRTAEFVTETLSYMSVLGSLFLGALAAAPAAVEALTKLTAFRGFAGTSVLIIVGVATDTARKVRAEVAMQKYGDLDRLYEEGDDKY